MSLLFWELKTPEPCKWAKVQGWKNLQGASQVVLSAMKSYKNSNKNTGFIRFKLINCESAVFYYDHTLVIGYYDYALVVVMNGCSNVETIT